MDTDGKGLDRKINHRTQTRKISEKSSDTGRKDSVRTHWTQTGKRQDSLDTDGKD